eukprot:GEMP01106477.1.p1 GENE.GEMP01106477.1~~GEMP01106477.1.p1  ORF type:complete len:119 (+),score=12.68 GEMP01106477.1:53-409(+)
MVLIDFPTVLWAAGAALFFGVGNAIANILDGFPESEHVPFVMQSAVCLLVAGIVSIIQSGLSICLYQRGCTCSCIYNYKATEFENPETRRRSMNFLEGYFCSFFCFPPCLHPLFSPQC